MEFTFSYKNYLKFSVARVFIAYVVAISILISSIGALINYYHHHEDKMHHLTRSIQALQQNQIPLIVDAIQIENLHSLNTIAKILISHPNIVSVEITDNTNSKLIDIRTETGINDDNIPFHQNLHSQEQEGSPGQLRMLVNLDNVPQQALDESIRYFTNQLIEVIVIASCISLLFYFMIGKHLMIVTKYAASLELGHLDRPMETLRKKTTFNQNDEISRLNDAMNNMRLNLLKSYQINQLAELDNEELIENLKGKNAELERFTYTVSHDLKTPLVTINGFIGLLEKDVKNGDIDSAFQDIKTIKDAATTMYTLLSDLLELARIGVQQNEREELSFNPLINEVLQLLNEQIQSKQATIEIEENLPLVKVERTLFSEVFLNLIENSLKYMKSQDHPLVKVGTTTIEGPNQQKELAFYVKDNGRGINPKYCEKIFQLFERVAVDVNGTGVGLAIVKRIIETHDGRIWVESDGQDNGATFYFVIPIIEGA